MTETSAPPRGKRLLALAVNQILEHPETWKQRDWHCDTKHCIGGHIQLMGGGECNGETVMEDVMNFTGISRIEAEWLCAPQRQLHEIYTFAATTLRAERYDVKYVLPLLEVPE